MFDEAGVRERIAATRFSRLRYLRETDSTNDVAARELGDPAAGGSLILAEYQRQGRGRRGRRWVAPAGSALLFTAVLPGAIPSDVLWVVPFWCALAVADGVEQVIGERLHLQWPNDLLLGARKVCGILCTSRVVGSAAWVACGIGINVVRPAVSDEADPDAAFLNDVQADVVREDVFVALVFALDSGLDLIADPPGVARAWEQRAGLAGTPYRIRVDGEPEAFEGTAVRLGREGGLVVQAGDGQREVALAEARVMRGPS